MKNEEERDLITFKDVCLSIIVATLLALFYNYMSNLNCNCQHNNNYKYCS